MIHACERCGSPAAFSCAVPVFAAAWMPLSSCIARPVPWLTTSIISAVRVSAVAAEIGCLPHLGVVWSRTPPSWYSVRVDHVRLHHLPAVGDRAGDHRHVQRHHHVAALAEAADRQQRQRSTKSPTSPKQLAAAPGRSIGHLLADAPRLGAGDHPLRAAARSPSGRTGCCSCGRRPRPSCRRTPSPP